MLRLAKQQEKIKELAQWPAPFTIFDAIVSGNKTIKLSTDA
ncbi:hypothetical protein A33I_02420 [Alkalihalophilus marmarensis DSM 21297]|uniref:Uncharacterized protein n=1 Tax=Alkalihalophilus marmarensis DSM 21297 TaxID=1188261 RepID=U6SI31_9BACI|nr:hypothetical protein A33I_02420 [Alkalihalophilus marmarensis DSM 21297]